MLPPVSSPAPVSCRYAERCPGCAWILRPPADQLAAKQALLERALAPYTTLAARVLPVQAAEANAGYRTRAKLAVAPGPRLGLFARASHDVLDLPGCPVLTPRLGAAADALRGLLAAPPPGAEVVLRAEGEGPGRLRAVDLREVENEAGTGVLLTLVLRAPAPDAKALEAASAALVAALPDLRSLALRLHDGRAPGLLGGPPQVIYGETWVADRLSPGTPSVLVSSGSFVQVHRGQALLLQAAALRALGKVAGKRVLDVYAGSGALGLALAAQGAKPLLVEGYARAAEAVEAAARQQGLALEVQSAPAERALPALRRAGARFEAAVANPPRAGMAPRAREALAALVTGPIVLISCEPRTLARDLAHFRELGFQLERLEPWDLMPLTDQVESLAVLRKATPPAAQPLHADVAFVAVAKPPGLPTLPLPEHGDSLLARVRALRGRGQAVALGRLELNASGVCLFASSPEQAPALQRALAAEGAEQQSLALVRGVARASGRLGATPSKSPRSERHASEVSRPAARYRRLDVVAGHALLELTSPAGATPSLRRLLHAIGEPVLGDERQGHAPSNRHLFERAGLDRSFLHVTRVRFAHPLSGAPLVIEAPLAPDLAAVIAKLGASA
jgi:23S rRNA (uracil1939-C5)-methyltransferase